nr:carbohydrate ABC transporter permease [uncultured Acetatifactor sp.]
MKKKKKAQKKHMFKARPFDWINAALLFVFAFTCIYPFWYILVYSLSDPLKATAGVFFWPVDFTLDNYRKVLTLKGIPRAALVSVSITIICTLEQMFISGYLGYLLSRDRMPYRKIIYRFFIGTMFVGGGLIPEFLLRKYLGLYDTYFIYIMPGVSAYNMILTKTFIENIPSSLEESAKLDGASYWEVLTRIILPLSKPILATIGVFTAVGVWSDYSTTLIYTMSKNLRTLQYILYQYLKEAASILLEEGNNADMRRQLTPMSIKMTLLVVTVVPILCVYPYMQKYFTKGIMLGSVKG